MTATVGRADDARPRDPATAPARSSLQYLNFSDGAAAADGPWASGPSFDGKGEYSYHDGPTSSLPMPPPTHPDVRFSGTTELPNVVEKTAGLVQDTLHEE